MVCRSPTVVPSRPWPAHSISLRSLLAYLVEVEDDVQLAHVGEVRLEQLHEKVHGLQRQQLVVVHVHPEREKEAGVSPVDELVRSELLKNAMSVGEGCWVGSVSGMERRGAAYELKMQKALSAGGKSRRTHTAF